MKADTCIEYLGVLFDGVERKIGWTEEAKRAYEGLRRHFWAAQKREKASK